MPWLEGGVTGLTSGLASNICPPGEACPIILALAALLLKHMCVSTHPCACLHSPSKCEHSQGRPCTPSTWDNNKYALDQQLLETNSHGPGEVICEAGLEESRSLPGREGLAGLRFSVTLPCPIITHAMNMCMNMWICVSTSMCKHPTAHREERDLIP